MGLSNEALRLEALHRLQILDTPPDPSFNRIVQIATRLLGTPIAMVTFVDRDRQWCKASVGIDLTETSCDTAFADHAISQPHDGPFVVMDARADPRFADNPLVTGEPGICFYAGHPLRAPGGQRVGTLCVIDRQQRTWTDVDEEVLHDLAMLVEHLLSQQELSQVSSALQRSETREAMMLETIHDGLTILDADGRIVQWNPAAERVLGLSPDEISGRTSLDPRWGAIHPDGTPWPGETHPTVMALTTGQPVRDAVMGVNRPTAGLVWLRVSSTPFVEPDGSVSGTLTSFADITEVIEADRGTLRGSSRARAGSPPAYDRRLLEHATTLFAAALEEASRKIEQEQAVLADILADLRSGVPFTETIERVDMGVERESLTTAVAGMEAARRGVRVHMFRALLAEGYSIGEIARLWGVSRQLASRILRDARDIDG